MSFGSALVHFKRFDVGSCLPEVQARTLKELFAVPEKVKATREAHHFPTYFILHWYCSCIHLSVCYGGEEQMPIASNVLKFAEFHFR